MVIALVRCRGDRGLLPDDLAAGAIDREHLEAMFFAGARTATRPAPPARGRGDVRLLSRRHRRRQEQPVARRDGCGVPAARNLSLPAHVRGVAPRQRHVRCRGPGMSGPAPVRPGGCRRTGLRNDDDGSGGQCEDGETKDESVHDCSFAQVRGRSKASDGSTDVSHAAVRLLFTEGRAQFHPCAPK